MAEKKKKTASKKTKASKKTSAKSAGIPVYNSDGEVKGHIELPPVFSTPIREDLIHRAVVAAEANRRQPYGADPMAGKRYSVEWPGKGRGMARTPRIRGGTGMARFAPNAVGGRRAFPPKPEKDYSKKVNRKERRLARFSAIAATAVVERVLARGHRFDEKLSLPIVVDSSVEEIKSASEAVAFLEKIGVGDDIRRAKEGRHIRAGRGKMRGRKYRQPRSLLFVIAPDEDGGTRHKALGFRNLPGVDVVSVQRLGTHHLAPGGMPGRLTMFSEKAMEIMRGWK